MTSKLLPLVIALFVGLCALLWGLATLEGIIVDERAQAYASIADREATLTEYARRTMEQRLEAKLHAQSDRFEAALHDPLAPTEGLLLVLEGVQRLPPQPRAAPGEDTPARDLYDELRRRHRPEGLDPGSPRDRRVELYFELRDALDRQDTPTIEHAMRSLLAHRARFLVDATFDVPLNVAMLDDFVATHEPHPRLMSTLLREGHDAGAGARVEALQHALLARRERFTDPDQRFLTDRIVALSEQAGVAVADFREAMNPTTAPPVPRPETFDQPMLLGGGHYYAAPHSASQLRGVSIDLPAAVQSLGDEMRRLALLHEDDDVTLARPTAPTPLAMLAFAIDAPRFVRARAEAEQRFRLKTGFVVASALLALLLATLAVMLQRRRHRFVELKSDFVATVSHELRTPLAAIRLMAETLARRTKNLPSARDYPDRIVREIDELSFLVENILSFNRLDKGRWQPRPVAVPLGPLLDELAEDLAAYGFDDVTLHADSLDDLTLEADRELLKLLLRNLAKNACTYNERTPVVLRVQVEERDGRCIIQFADNGVGIPPTDQPRIFEDFRRGSQTKSRGSGLGLSICRKCMEAHAGRISIAHSDESGTRFDLDFPATMIVPPS